MFENYKQLSAEEKEQVKALYKAVRSDGSHGPRYRFLAWGFIRGFKYRRMERKTRTQVMGDGSVFVHNKPSAYWLTKLLQKYLPDLVEPSIKLWLEDPSGAIPAPAPRLKRPYSPREAVA